MLKEYTMNTRQVVMCAISRMDGNRRLPLYTPCTHHESVVLSMNLPWYSSIAPSEPCIDNVQTTAVGSAVWSLCLCTFCPSVGTAVRRRVTLTTQHMLGCVHQVCKREVTQQQRDCCRHHNSSRHLLQPH